MRSARVEPRAGWELSVCMRNCGARSDYARLGMRDDSVHPSLILADWTWIMARKSRNPNFDQTLEKLRAASFDVADYPGAAGGKLVSKYGVGAVLVAPPSTDDDGEGAFALRPGILPRLASGLPVTSRRSIVMSIGGAALT